MAEYSFLFVYVNSIRTSCKKLIYAAEHRYRELREITPRLRIKKSTPTPTRPCPGVLYILIAPIRNVVENTIHRVDGWRKSHKS